MAGKTKAASKTDATKGKEAKQGSKAQKEADEMVLGREQEVAGEMNQGALAQAGNQSDLTQKTVCFLQALFAESCKIKM